MKKIIKYIQAVLNLDIYIVYTSTLMTFRVQISFPIFSNTIQHLDQEVRKVDDLTESFLKGEKDFHEVAVQIRQSDLALKYAFAVRNKLVDAYREVMRMSV